VSRIRSIHPGLWTDEAFVSLSPMARLMLLGIWNECDDMGSFAWSPLTLKMRILPGDNADANALLAEMVAARAIMKYEVAGKIYGAVRNFCQFQRPKKPNSTCPQTKEVTDWVNINARSTRDGSEAVPNQLPTNGEISRQMEDGGDKGIRIASSNEDVSVAPTEPPPTKDEVLEAWATRMVPLGFPRIAKMTAQRERLLRARLKDSTFDEWQRAMSALERSAFCRGENDRGWRADFDFLLQTKSFTKLLEGAYDH
jgi:hypothetical protein